MASNSEFPRKGEIWLVDYTLNFSKEFEVESKIKKLRPSLILSNNIQNENSDDILVAPITGIEVNRIELTEILIEANKESGLVKDSKALIYIIRTIDKNYRLKNYIGKIDNKKLKNVEEVIKLVFDL